MGFKKLLKKLLPVTAIITAVMAVPNPIFADEVIGAVMSNSWDYQNWGEAEMSYYNFNSGRGDEELLDKTKVTVTKFNKNLSIKGTETISLDSVFADVSVIFEDREEISANFTSEGKFSDNFLLDCSQESGIASIALKIKDEEKPMQLKSVILEIRIPLVFQGNFDLKNFQGDIAVTGDINCKNFKTDSSYGNLSFNNIVSVGDFELNCFQGGFKGESLEAKSLVINNKYAPVNLGRIEADSVDLTSFQGDIAVTGDIKSKSVAVDGSYSDIKIQKIDAEVRATLNSSDIFLKFMPLNNDITIDGAYSDVSIFLPDGASFTADCLTTYRNINNSFGLEVKKSKYGTDVRMTGVVNSGEHLLNIDMTNSSIVLAK